MTGGRCLTLLMWEHQRDFSNPQWPELSPYTHVPLKIPVRPYERGRGPSVFVRPGFSCRHIRLILVQHLPRSLVRRLCVIGRPVPSAEELGHTVTRSGEQRRAAERQLEIVDSWCAVLVPVLSIELGPKDMKVVGPHCV